MSDSDRSHLFAFDIESTGTNPAEDRIVELAWAEFRTPITFGHDRIQVQRFNPGVPIPEETTEVHGITDEDVEEEPPFDRLARMYQEYVDRAEYLLHYNGRTFDTLMLDAELQRAGQPGVDLEEQKEIDLYRLWKHLEPRSLEGALRRFGDASDREDHDPHTAEGDVGALFPVLWGMTEAYELELQTPAGMDLDQLSDLCEPEDEVDRSGKLCMIDGEVCFAVGKHKGEPVLEHWDYAEWMLQEKDDDHPPDTKAALRELLSERDESLTGREVGGKG